MMDDGNPFCVIHAHLGLVNFPLHFSIFVQNWHFYAASQRTMNNKVPGWDEDEINDRVNWTIYHFTLSLTRLCSSQLNSIVAFWRHDVSIVTFCFLKVVNNQSLHGICIYTPFMSGRSTGFSLPRNARFDFQVAFFQGNGNILMMRLLDRVIKGPIN